MSSFGVLLTSSFFNLVPIKVCFFSRSMIYCDSRFISSLPFYWQCAFSSQLFFKQRKKSFSAFRTLEFFYGASSLMLRAAFSTCSLYSESSLCINKQKDKTDCSNISNSDTAIPNDTKSNNVKLAFSLPASGEPCSPLLLTPPRVPPLAADYTIEVLYEDTNYLVVNKPRDVRLEKSRYSHLYPCVETLVRRYLNRKHTYGEKAQEKVNDSGEEEKMMKEIRSNTEENYEDNDDRKNRFPQKAPEVLTKFRISGQLDYGTSGVLILAFNKTASSIMNKCIQMRKLCKIYLCMCYGHMPSLNHLIQCKTSICNPSPGCYEMRAAGDRTEGRFAYSLILPFLHTYYKNHEVTLCELRTVTGRRHQLRLHLSTLGHPIVGDKIYFNSSRIEDRYEEIEDVERMMLHCWIVRCNLIKMIEADDDTRRRMKKEVAESSVALNADNDNKQECIKNSENSESRSCYSDNKSCDFVNSDGDGSSSVFEVIAEDCISPYVNLDPRNKNESKLIDSKIDMLIDSLNDSSVDKNKNSNKKSKSRSNFSETANSNNNKFLRNPGVHQASRSTKNCATTDFSSSSPHCDDDESKKHVLKDHLNCDRNYYNNYYFDKNDDTPYTPWIYSKEYSEILKKNKIVEFEKAHKRHAQIYESAEGDIFTNSRYSDLNTYFDTLSKKKFFF